MGKRISIEEKITRIKHERHELLNMVSDNIKNNRNILVDDIKNVFEVLNYDEKTVKRYEAVVKAKELIASLTEEICNAQTADEIIALRNKINYYINKIKNELKTRNVSEECLIKYQESANYLRKDIAKFIRVIKREVNINNIDNYNNTYLSLTDEEKEQFKKLLGREYRYNHRNLNPKEINKKPKNKKENIVIETISKEDDEMLLETPLNEIIEPKTISIELTTEETEPEITITETTREIVPEGVDTESLGERILSFNITPELQPEDMEDAHPAITVSRVVDSTEDITDRDIEYLKIKIKSFDSRYNVHSLYDYGDSIISGINGIIKNIPLYKANKRTIRRMSSDTSYYGGSDFISYIAYLTRINSIKHGLKSVFSRSYLSSSEVQLLNDHDKCAEWIIDFCKRNSMDINFLNRKILR